jgi:hypothetical protein
LVGTPATKKEVSYPILPPLINEKKSPAGILKHREMYCMKVRVSKL